MSKSFNLKEFDTEEEWLQNRKGKITGTKLKDIAGSKRNYTVSDIEDELEKRDIEYDSSDLKDEKFDKLPIKAQAQLRIDLDSMNLGFYEIIAERVAVPKDPEEPAIDRGKRLEDEAIEKFEEETGKEVNDDLVMLERKDNPAIALSPDGLIGVKEAVEVKCQDSPRFIKAYLTEEIPKKYRKQVLQYFIVNDGLEKLYFVFYDDRMPFDMFYYTVERDEVLNKIRLFTGIEEEVTDIIDQTVDDLLSI